VQQWNVRKLKESLRVSHKTDVYNQSNLWLERMNVWTAVKISTFYASVKISFPYKIISISIAP